MSGHALVLDGVAGHALVHALRFLHVLTSAGVVEGIRAEGWDAGRLRLVDRVVGDGLGLASDLDGLAVVQLLFHLADALILEGHQLLELLELVLEQAVLLLKVLYLERLLG